MLELFEVPHDCAVALFMVSMYFLGSFYFNEKEVATQCFVEQYPSSLAGIVKCSCGVFLDAF